MQVNACSFVRTFCLLFCVGANLCGEYEIDAESFVEQWMAFSLSNLNGAPPSLKDLDLLERKEFSKRAAVQPVSAAIRETSQNAGRNLTIYGGLDEEQYPFRLMICCYIL